VINLENGLIERLASAELLASYAGAVPRLKSNGARSRNTHFPKQSNHYLKWAFTEAAMPYLGIGIIPVAGINM
jgi:transposase